MAKKDTLGVKRISKEEQEKPAIDKKAYNSYAFETLPDPQGYIAALPDQEIAESLKTPDWYIENVKYICSWYNVPFQNILAPLAYDDVDATSTINRPINQMIKYIQYYLGKQPNLDYNHLTQNVTESNLQAVWIKGNDISELVKFMKGNILDRITSINISARPMSEDAVSKREDLYKKLSMKVDLKPVFDRLAQAGMEYAPANGQEFEDEDSIKKWIEEASFKDVGAEIATDISKNFWYTNFCASKFIQAFNYCTIAGVAAMEHYVDNGKNYMKVRKPYQLILDTRIDEDYNRDAMFVGTIDCMTPQEIFSRWRKQFNSEQKEEIYEMAKNQNLGIKYNTITNFSWWNYGSQRQVSTISVVTVYWYGKHDLGLKKKKNKYGTNTIGKTEKGEEGEYALTDVYKATLIGNRYLVDWGLIDNVVEEFTDKTKPVFPIFRFMPDMVGGEFLSPVARLTKMQDEVDALNFKVREMIGRAKGKTFIVRGDKLGNGTNAMTLIEDLSKLGIHVATTSAEAGDSSDRDALIETVDLTLDPNIMTLVALIEKKQNAMKQVVSTSDIALGQQTQYIGLGTQQASIGQTTFGLKYLYEGFLDFVQLNLQYATNVEGRLLAIGGDTVDSAMIVGDQGKRYLDLMKVKELSFEDILVYLKLNDPIDDKAKAGLQQALQALLQNGQISILDWIECSNAQTYVEMKDKMEYSVKQNEKKRAEAEKVAHDRAMELQSQQNQANLQAESLRQAGQSIRGHQANDVSMLQQQPEEAQQQLQ